MIGPDAGSVSQGTGISDSDDEPDAKTLFSEPARGQADLASAVGHLKSRIDVGGPGS